MSDAQSPRPSRRHALLGAVALAAAALTTAGPAAAAATEPMIIGGHDASETYPFMVSLQLGGQHHCGGSLVAPEWVVTAAHCAQAAPADYQARIGSTDRTTGGETAAVTELIPHPDFNPEAGGDIALVRLDHPVSAAPIGIAAESGAVGAPTRILGWGQPCAAEDCEQPVVLQELDTMLVDDTQCTKFDGATELCTGSETPNAMACHGDSGGPEIAGRPGAWELIGATSRDGDEDPACASGLGIWTDVTTYAPWINEHIGA